MSTDTIRVHEENAGERLDVFLTKYLKSVSRAHIQELIENRKVTLNGYRAKSSVRVSTDDVIIVVDEEEIECELQPEPVDFEVLHSDEAVIVINKPSGLVVHPARKHLTGTLVNGLLHRFGPLPLEEDPTRPGIVHRLDKATSGVMVAARTRDAYYHLKKQFKERSVSKIYNAIVHGVPRFQAQLVQTFVRLAPGRFNKMEVAKDGKEAITYYEVVKSYGPFSLLEVQLKTGRMHQIRLHCRHEGHPVLCDPLYGRETVINTDSVKGMGIRAHARPVLERLALHARELSFTHPVTEKPMHFEAPLPVELQSFLDLLDEQYEA